MSVPTQAEIYAAYISMPRDLRDLIGVIAVDMVFQSFVHGDAYVACDQLEDLPIYDQATREAAFKAEDARLNELHKVVEAALPDLFGKNENPAWCENPGTIPTAAARAWAAMERAARAERQATFEAEMKAADAVA